MYIGIKYQWGGEIIKEKHTISISSDTWRLLEYLKYATRRSISSIIDESVRHYVQSNAEWRIYAKLTSVPAVDDKEQKEIEKLLNSLADDDLKVVKVEELTVNEENTNSMDKES